MQEVLVDRSEFVLEDLVQVRDDFDVALHGDVLPGNVDGVGQGPFRSGSLRRLLAGRKSPLVQQLASAGLACTAAGGDTRAVLQLLERPSTLPDGLVEPLFRDAVADADVHGSEPRAGS
jgi:hypothetical protein